MSEDGGFPRPDPSKMATREIHSGTRESLALGPRTPLREGRSASPADFRGLKSHVPGRPAQHRVHPHRDLPLSLLQDMPQVLDVSTMDECPRRFFTSSSVKPWALGDDRIAGLA